jgi:hypothetical protein
MTDQNEFKGWARVEVMGHQSHIGFVTTETYGQAVLFRIDQPAVPGGEETLKRAEWVGDVFAGAGSVVQRQPIESVSVLVGSGSIYRIIPCDEATAMSAIRSSQRRPLSMVSLVPGNRLAAPKEIHDEDEDDSSL